MLQAICCATVSGTSQRMCRRADKWNTVSTVSIDAYFNFCARLCDSTKFNTVHSATCNYINSNNQVVGIRHNTVCRTRCLKRWPQVRYGEAANCCSESKIYYTSIHCTARHFLTSLQSTRSFLLCWPSATVNKGKGKSKETYSSLQAGLRSPLRELTYHMGSYKCYLPSGGIPATRLYPSRSWYSI